MDMKRIQKLATDIERINRVKAIFKRPECVPQRAAAIELQGCDVFETFAQNPLQAFIENMVPAMNKEIDAERARLVAQLEAELKGVICPQPEPDPDAYLAPLTEAFGPHGGLNADWCTMAWCVSGGYADGVWVLDDEHPDQTVSLVSRITLADGESVNTTLVSGLVAQILPIAKAIAVQVQHG